MELKKLFLFFLLLLAVNTAQAAVNTANLVSYYPLGNTTDIIGGYNLSNLSNPANTYTGFKDDAYQFVASESRYMILPSSWISKVGGDTEGTISFWVYPNSSQSVAAVFGIGDAGVSSRRVRVGIQSGNMTLFTPDISVGHQNNLTSGSWYHVVILQNGTSSVWVNGVMSVVTDSNEWFNSYNTGLDTARLGARAFSLDAFFDGLIDEFSYWNTSLTPSEISELYNSGSGLFYCSETSNFTDNCSPAPLNDAPSLTLNDPLNSSNVTTRSLQFNYTPVCYGGGCTQADLYINFSDNLAYERINNNNPVLHINDSSGWDSTSIFSSTTPIWNGTHYILFYSGSNASSDPDWTILHSAGMAESEDGLNWVRSGSDGLCMERSDKGYGGSSQGIFPMDLVEIGGVYYMFMVVFTGVGTNRNLAVVNTTVLEDCNSWGDIIEIENGSTINHASSVLLDPVNSSRIYLYYASNPGSGVDILSMYADVNNINNPSAWSTPVTILDDGSETLLYPQVIYDHDVYNLYYVTTEFGNVSIAHTSSSDKENFSVGNQIFSSLNSTGWDDCYTSVPRFRRINDTNYIMYSGRGSVDSCQAYKGLGMAVSGLNSGFVVHNSSNSINNNTLNTLYYHFTGHLLPNYYTWNVLLTQSDDQTVWASNNFTFLLDVNANVSTTLNASDNVPLSPVNLSSPSQTKNSIYIIWDNDVNTSYYDHTELWLDSVNVANYSGEEYNFTGLIPNTSYNISIYNANSSGSRNETYDSIIVSTLVNLGANISINYPNQTDTLQENATYSFNVTATDDDGGNLIVTWFLNAVQVFQETVISGAQSVWYWVVGYDDQGIYNVTVEVNDTFNTTTTIEYNITINDTYPKPLNPAQISPNSGNYEYSIPLLCDISNQRPVEPYYVQFVYGLNGNATTNEMNVNDTDGFINFDISNYPYGTTLSFGCRVESLSGVGNYTYSGNFTKSNKNNFYLYENKYNTGYQAMKPYTLGLLAEAENTLGFSIAATIADCNGDGVSDYSFDYRGLNYTKANEEFACINTRGKAETTIGMILFKNNTLSWDTIGCYGAGINDNYCVVYKTYELSVQ